MEYTVDNHISSLFRVGYSRETPNKHISFIITGHTKISFEENFKKETLSVGGKDYWINRGELESWKLHNIDIKDIKYMWYESKFNDPFNYEAHLIYQSTDNK